MARPPLVVLALALATVLRLADLAVRPFHHDEGVNAWFFARLWYEGHYRYDPGNYHGPTLYFLSLPAAWLAGGPDGAVLRGVVVAVSLATAALVALLRPLGPAGAAAAALFLGVSPSAVYFGRDYIHESLFVLFTLAAVVLGARFAETRRAAPLAGAGVAAGLLVATKETAFPTLALLGLALLAADPGALRRPLERPRAFLAAVLGALVVAVAAYTNGFTEWAALLDPLRALPGWISRGIGGQEHAKPAYTYLLWLYRLEPALLALGAAGVALGVARRAPFDRFVAVWTVGTVGFYSALSYKTPWLLVDLVLPLALAAGVAVRIAWGWGSGLGDARRRSRTRAAVVAAASLAAVSLAWRAWDVAVVRYDDPDAVLPYAQTVRGYRGLLAAIDRATAGRDPAQVRIAVTAPEYWPLPWDLWRFRDAAWHGKPMSGLAHDLVIAPAGVPPPVADPAAYDLAVYPLRPGIELALYVRRR